MKKSYLIILILVLTSASSVLFKAKSEDFGGKSLDILQQATKTILEKPLEKDKKAEVIESGQITFKTKRLNLWLKEKSIDEKKLNELVEITLPGKLYSPSKEILMVEKKEVDRSTIEGTIASVFSANRSGDINWISDNFTDKDKEQIKKLFTNKKTLEDSKSDAQKIISVYITGQADYKGSVLVFIEEGYINGKKIKESIACKKTEKGWKVTNEFSSDKTFDIVFAALSSGEVSLKGKESQEQEPAKDSKS